MQIDIRSRGVKLDSVQKLQVNRRLRFSLDRFQRLLSMARIRLEDLNGPKGGVDTVCRITVDGPAVGRVVVEQRSLDVASAVDGAADRLTQVLTRLRDRARQSWRHQAQALRRAQGAGFGTFALDLAG
jgi:putative sigma-54 modulation protein